MNTDNKEELQIIANTFLKGIVNVSNIGFIGPIVLDAILDSLTLSSDVGACIKYIIATHKELIPSLLIILKEHYPEKLEDAEKLIPLI